MMKSELFVKIRDRQAALVSLALTGGFSVCGGVERISASA